MVNWWPWIGGNDVIINNNYPGGYYPGAGCCGGCGGGMPPIFATWMKYSMISNFFNMAMNNIFPNRNQQQQQAIPPYACQYYPTMYPGLYLQNGLGGAGAVGADGLGGSAANGKNDYMIMQSLAKTYNLSIVGPSNDGEYYLKAKGKKPIKFSSFDELKEYMEEKYTTTADDVQEEEPTKKTKAADAKNDDADEVESDKKTDTKAAEEDDGTDKKDKTDKTPAQNGTKYKLGKLTEGYEWKNYNKLTQAEKDKLKKDMSLDELCNALGIRANDTNKNLLKKANPNGIKDDKVADLSKLTVIHKKDNAVNNENGNGTSINTEYTFVQKNNNFTVTCTYNNKSYKSTHFNKEIAIRNIKEQISRDNNNINIANINLTKKDN